MYDESKHKDKYNSEPDLR